MNRAQALHHGFDHEGWFGILPIWFRAADSSVAGKNALADLLVPVVGTICLFVGWSVLDPHFGFRLRPIEREELARG